MRNLVPLCMYPTVNASTRRHKHTLVIGKGSAWPSCGLVFGRLHGKLKPFGQPEVTCS